jgi:hypothetical protein
VSLEGPLVTKVGVATGRIDGHGQMLSLSRRCCRCRQHEGKIKGPSREGRSFVSHNFHFVGEVMIALVILAAMLWPMIVRNSGDVDGATSDQIDVP